MNKELLKEAADHLSLFTINLESEKVQTAKDVCPEFQQYAELAIQMRNDPVSAGTLAVLSEQGEQEVLVYKHAMAMRVVNEHEADEDGQPQILLEIQTTYRVSYSIKDGLPSQEAMAEFALHNVPHHIWPFWREQVNATVLKAGLPSVVIPMRHYKASE
ncbi:protein-export chaperone SecB [Sansalvadorimonas sp. 2012CJ34-2]|uniref:Protein-export chaperone SecB n=1 Tax=Parendozoicomonas callyspongiae TaxID=2942213 RepID=A0ABT0PIM0_9GAMM|nr:protein-export chaperone SecB [Sansalvadorimonas sp. 2012CJ34-2]MCL6271224.1 protein-export chaperone SecB [Sansalvadorimonas sp. 2012CJ34-2]